MNKILHFFMKPFSTISRITGLIRLKVFYQILVIIAMMIIFLGLQTYMNLKTINTMQQTTQVLFTEHSNELNQITKLKQDITNLQVSYLEALLNDNHSAYQAVLNLIENNIIFDWMDEEDRKSVSGKFESIKKLVTQTPSSSNYALLRNHFFELSLVINQIESKLSLSTVGLIANNNQFLSESKSTGIIIVTASFLLSIFIGLLIVNSISVPLKQVEKAAKAIAIGDLSHKITTIGSPEILKPINGLNQAIDGLRDLVKKINSQSKILFTTSQELKIASSETGKSASEVAQAMEELAIGSTKQAEQITQTADTIRSLSEIINQVSDDTEKIASASEEVARAAKVGLQATIEGTNEIQELYLSTKKINKIINELSNATSEIGEITSVIQGVAEQTSLLALNAAIEAARAGEQGKGFAVVAQETGKLAEQSKQAAGLIVDLITNIRLQTTEAVKTMEIGMQRAESGKNLTIETSETFKKISQSLSNNLVQIEAVAQSARKMAESNNVVIKTINDMAAICEENLASTEEVTATTEEQSASTQQVAALADNLNQIADNLHQAVAVFKLED